MNGRTLTATFILSPSVWPFLIVFSLLAMPLSAGPGAFLCYWRSTGINTSNKLAMKVYKDSELKMLPNEIKIKLIYNAKVKNYIPLLINYSIKFPSRRF